MRDNRSKPLKDRTFSKILGYNGEHKIYKLDKSRGKHARVVDTPSMGELTLQPTDTTRLKH